MYPYEEIMPLPEPGFEPSFGLPGVGAPPSFGPPGFGPPPSFGPPSFGPPPSTRPPSFGPPPPFGPPSFGPPPAGQMPLGPPPSFTPAMPSWGIGTSGIQSCLFRNTYIWMFNGSGFWFFLTSVGREFITGFRWSSRSGWRFQTIARRNILSYECSRW
ncbi:MULTISPECIES: transporter [unclassified Lysinibacillus]|uniref:transporter n=1 Tax=unclassified Lysinibacillus TaxID=2636778 RepID=UPI002012BE21|nr:MULTISPECIES: transporter [unclassified Lysinibacillus]MCL1697190.1 transporter [Lysinibacillus sp. BPa_S21]MCL1701878.1 transporter [Lysinibacillus sp. Bpr_S20]